MDDKNLDKLFRDKFKVFRETPDEKVWTAIDRSLDKKRKNRVIPLWWSLGGVAAVLALALLVFLPSDDGLNETPAVTDTERTEAEVRDRMDADRLNQDDMDIIEEDGSDSNGEQGTSSEGRGQGDENQGREDENQDLKNGNSRKPIEDEGEEGVEQSQENRNRSKEDKSSREENQRRQQENQKQRLEKKLQISVQTEEAIANSSKDADLKNTADKGILNIPNPAVSRATFDITNTDTDAASHKRNESGQDNIRKDDLNQYPEESQLTSNEKIDGDRKNSGNRIPKTNQSDGMTDENPDALMASQNRAPSRASTVLELSESPSEKLAQNEVDSEENKSTIDEASTGNNRKSVLEALEEQAEEEELAESSRSRWSAGPSIAPVYFNAMGEGSPIDPGFAANGKSGNTNFSYGLSVAYEVTKKLSVRSGIHKIDYGYDTNNVPFSQSLGAFANGGLENIDYSGASNNLAVSDVASELESTNSFAPEFSSLNSTREGTVAQQFGYLEIPLEVDYALVDNRFGLNLVGGISSLFLIDNSVTLNSEDLSTEIGEASNLNELNFSTNIGFGINYKFTPAIRLNVEPVFKYQLNTFSNTSGDFRPYSIGVYSGLNFRF